ncbi:MAG: ubiquinone biosynthesis hydroxylase [Candidatus Tokpelaia sp.]|nr:MAG: ubiquinone biosynthesis hydroxylase [Candidatus Tokpelaia sp.]KAA6207006.1 MAG: ubiquinone biosynthesis hydroxylase [Candidatus Tokpelaia sp.]
METEQKNSEKPHEADIIIVGGAYVGLCLAVAVKEACPQLDIIVLDAGAKDAWQHDLRASAIAAAAVRMLGRLGLWQAVLPEAEPIREMIVTDSRLNDPVRPVFLTFSGDVEPHEAFAYMVENRHLNAALHKKAAELGVKYQAEAKATDFAGHGGGVRVSLQNGALLQGRLLVAADGVRSLMREKAGITIYRHAYGQVGIVCTVAHEKPHYGRAEEHFLPAGPFAVLPLKGNRSSLVWNENEEEAKRLLAADDFVFEAELERRFGRHLGHLKLEGGRCGFPFALVLAREFVRPRFALAGDAAHGIHPISGQGLNLGFRDVAALAEVLVEAARLGLDIGALNVLERYQAWRRFETFRMGVTTDILNRMFANDFAPLRAARDFGLCLVDKMPFLKNYFIKEASGLITGSPRLLLGRAL